ncbi:MAG: alpha/beta hydrolase fold domain-containing protein [Deltaproteobacteria bacterium]|nr:alpha/beta hydrolase fold domain-containing protein [Deltaproteobacteria bacterium]MBW2360672.1 alpha/beta hydrolase fold domain-containing protein [Deltaproteobacteria bacterium]
MIRALVAFVAGGLLVAGVFFAQRFTATAPASELVSAAASEAAAANRESMRPHLSQLLTGDIETRRAILDEHFYGPKIEEARRLYPVREEVLEIEGVYTEVFEPAGGVAPGNAGRVLINLHGGAFSLGARTEGRLESIPVAFVSGMRVVSVDYRQGPEHRFPAASEDVATVYRHLLETHAPAQIGVFGCSAGGMLTAQAVAWFDANDLPQPGAVGIFCAGAGKFAVGDAAVIGAAFGEFEGGGELDYFADADWNDPLVAPIEHPALLSRFPPALIVTSTRDGALSSAIVTHQRLVGAGVEAELHVYEGLPHYFFADTGLPESRHVFDVIARFFTRRLAR